MQSKMVLNRIESLPLTVLFRLLSTICLRSVMLGRLPEQRYYLLDPLFYGNIHKCIKCLTLARYTDDSNVYCANGD